MCCIPNEFEVEIAKAEARLDGSRRHLLLIQNEGLHVLERWRAERHFIDRNEPHLR